MWPSPTVASDPLPPSSPDDSDRAAIVVRAFEAGARLVAAHPLSVTTTLTLVNLLVFQSALALLERLAPAPRQVLWGELDTLAAQLFDYAAADYAVTDTEHILSSAPDDDTPWPPEQLIALADAWREGACLPPLDDDPEPLAFVVWTWARLYALLLASQARQRGYTLAEMAVCHEGHVQTFRTLLTQRLQSDTDPRDQPTPTTGNGSHKNQAGVWDEHPQGASIGAGSHTTQDGNDPMPQHSFDVVHAAFMQVVDEFRLTVDGSVHLANTLYVSWLAHFFDDLPTDRLLSLLDPTLNTLNTLHVDMATAFYESRPHGDSFPYATGVPVEPSSQAMRQMITRFDTLIGLTDDKPPPWPVTEIGTALTTLYALTLANQARVSGASVAAMLQTHTRRVQEWRTIGFPEEYAKFLAVALPWVISGTGASHLLVPLTS